MKNNCTLHMFGTILFLFLFFPLQSQEFDGFCLYNPLNNRTTYLIDADGTVIEKLGWYNRPALEPSKMETAIKTYLDLS